MASGSSKICEVKRPPNRNYAGLFATKNIQRGSRIFSEAALFASEHPKPIDICCMVRDLPKNDRDAYLNLRHHGYLDLAAQEEDLEELRQLFKDDDRLRGTEGPVPKRNVYERTLLLSNVDPVTKKVRHNGLQYNRGANLVAIFKVNHFKIRNWANTGDQEGIFLDAARLKHSCTANCYVSWNPVLNMLCVHATRNIHAGEELCISYDADLLIFENGEQRKARLQTYGLVCECAACDSSTEFGKSHNENREEIVKIREQLVEVYYLEPDPPKLMELYTELLKYLEDEAGTWAEGKVHVTLARIHLENDRQSDTARELGEAGDIAKTCFGEDHPTTTWLKLELQRVQRHCRDRISGDLVPEVRSLYDAHVDIVPPPANATVWWIRGADGST